MLEQRHSARTVINGPSLVVLSLGIIDLQELKCALLIYLMQLVFSEEGVSFMQGRRRSLLGGFRASSAIRGGCHLPKTPRTLGYDIRAPLSDLPESLGAFRCLEGASRGLRNTHH